MQRQSGAQAVPSQTSAECAAGAGSVPFSRVRRRLLNFMFSFILTDIFKGCRKSWETKCYI